MTESILEMAERHVVEGTARVVRQRQLIGEMEQAGHEQVEQARRLLATFEDVLEAMQEHLRVERERHG